MAKKKAYVVWVGHEPGVYKSWTECEEQVKGYPNASFKGFGSVEEANAAYSKGGVIPADIAAQKPSGNNAKPSGPYLAVDAAYSHSTRVLEWRGVLVDESGTAKQVFRSHPYRGGSANVGEFLGIVDGIEYLKENGLKVPIYSDSYNAQKWVREKAHNSSVPGSDMLLAMLDRANDMLKSGLYESVAQKIDIKDWNTREWGEIPADFGRKSGRGLEVAEGMVL